MLEILAHTDLSHQLVLVAVHTSQLAHVGEDVLQPIRQLKGRNKIRSDLFFLNEGKYMTVIYICLSNVLERVSRLYDKIFRFHYHWQLCKCVT